MILREIWSYLSKKARDDCSVVCADDGVEQDLIEPGIKVSFEDGDLMTYQLRMGVGMLRGGRDLVQPRLLQSKCMSIMKCMP